MRDLKFIIQKRKGNQSNIVSLQEIHALLGLQQLENTIKELKKELSEKSDITKEDVTTLLKEDVLLVGEPFNITHAANIEKRTKIAIGTIYYNVTKDVIRIKKKKGWTNI